MPVTSQLPPDIETIRRVVADVCRQHQVASLQVFGSVASGQANADSDIDFLVKFSPTANGGLLEMGGLKEDLEDALGCPVDLVSLEAVEASSNPYRKRSILAAPVTVYA